ncbi:nuclear pore complex protein Nup107 [Chloropicon primus]|uniref:Nuclear pore complex protein n=3 Tax=Chloropicon primus TaxID=1764295 RepID=A0A5B8MQ96_9CHLO|nr:nuclear pore complex protein Nup107 [Chloropicon primus]UPR01805.1 nuclear pore complex protein Nup107 [Chloropicon primus]|eukprot:QDZ22583.1 nuclear pore complex protein Nup107 [Chloropicon primus]
MEGLGRGLGGFGPPPALSYADERGLLEELEQAATGQLDLRAASSTIAHKKKSHGGVTAGGRHGLDATADRNLLPYVSVFEARSNELVAASPSGGASPAPPGYGSSSSVLGHPQVQASPYLASRSPAKQPLSRRDEIEAESVLDNQNVEVSYAQMMTKLGLDSLQGKPLDECLRSSLVELEGYCLKRSFQLSALCRKMMHNTMKYVSYKNAAAEMRQEAATWCLLRHLFFEIPVFLDGPAGGDGVDAMDLGVRTSAASQVVAESILADEGTKDLANVVSWLEFLSGLDLDENEASGLPKVGTGDGVWSETKTQSAIGNAKVVTELDPDAPARQGKELSSENAKDNERLLKVVWSLLRAGRLRDACNICRECGQPWRAASLAVSGGFGPTLVGEVSASQQIDPTFMEKEYEAAADESDVEPGLRRFLWKLSCQAISESASGDASTSAGPDAAGGGLKPLYEAATYGSFCGNTRRVLPVCSSWEDVVWAYSRSLLERKVDDTIAELVPPSSQSRGLWIDQRPSGVPTTLEEIFDAVDGIDASESAQLVQERDQMQRQIQLFMIVKDYGSLLDCLRKWILHPSDHSMGEFSFGEPPASPSAMRFAAHLVLFLRFLGIVPSSSEGNEFSEHQDLVNKVLQVYTIHLMDTEQHDLIPVYAAHLRDTSLDLTYMIFLDEMMKYSLVEQQKCYVLACKYLGESVARLTCKYATKVMQEARGPIEENAEHRANAALWLCYEESMYHSALQHSLALCRDFSMGGLKCYEAASTLLLQVLPVEFWKWLEALKFEGSHADVNRMDMMENDTKAFMASASEIEDWREWYEFQDSIRKWISLCGVIQTDVGPDRPGGSSVSVSNAQSLRHTGEKLMDQALGLLTRKWLQTQDLPDDHVESSDLSVFLTCSAVEKPAGHEGRGFAGGAVVEGFRLGVLESALNEALQSEGGHYAASVKAAGEADKFEVSLCSAKGAAEGDGPMAANQVDLEAAAYIIGWAIKGNLSKDLQDIGLNVQHLDCGSHHGMSRFICRQICMSKLVLQCIYIRQVLSSLPGADPGSSAGQNLVQMIVGGNGSSADLTHYLSPFQVQELVLMEREATINEIGSRQ